MTKAAEFTNANIWTDWVPESALADVLSGADVVANIGQVKGLWKSMLDREVRAGRLAKWRGKWFPVAGAHFGLGPDRDCYGTPEIAESMRALREQHGHRVAA